MLCPLQQQTAFVSSWKNEVSWQKELQLGYHSWWVLSQRKTSRACNTSCEIWGSHRSLKSYTGAAHANLLSCWICARCRFSSCWFLPKGDKGIFAHVFLSQTPHQVSSSQVSSYVLSRLISSTIQYHSAVALTVTSLGDSRRLPLRLWLLQRLAKREQHSVPRLEVDWHFCGPSKHVPPIDPLTPWEDFEMLQTKPRMKIGSCSSFIYEGSFVPCKILDAVHKPRRSGVNGWSGCQRDCLCLCALGCCSHLFGLGIAMATGTMSQASPCLNTQKCRIFCRRRISQQMIVYKGPNFKCGECISTVCFNMLECTQDN